MQPQVIPIIMRFLHNLFTALWIGGLLSMVLTVIPGIRKKLEQPWPVIESIQNCLRPIAIISIVGLAITGMLLGRSSQQFTGFVNFGTPYMNALSIKHILTLVMIVLAIARLMVNKKLQTEKSAKLQKVSYVILVTNTVLGVIVLFLSSMI